jgi:transcriptional regulator GlxA family with amidase domain
MPVVRDPDSRVNATVDLMRTSDGTIAIREAAERIGLSERQLERLCVRNLGLTPKEFARTVRLQAVVRWLIARSEVNVAEAAAQFGYSDQAHLGREFTALGGLSPTSYLRTLRDLRFSLHSAPIPMSDLF